jgi:hypothetical protein
VFTEEKTFTLRFSLEAAFPEHYDGDDDQYQWVGEWDGAIKGEVLKAVFSALRRHPGWSARVRNRGKSEQDEIEIAMLKDFGLDAAPGAPPPSRELR